MQDMRKFGSRLSLCFNRARKVFFSRIEAMFSLSENCPVRYLPSGEIFGILIEIPGVLPTITYCHACSYSLWNYVRAGSTPVTHC